MPFYALKLKEEVQNIDRVNKVNEGIANIALSLFNRIRYYIYYLKVHRQVEIIVLSIVKFIQHVKKGSLLELVRNIPNHYSRPILFSL